MKMNKQNLTKLLNHGLILHSKGKLDDADKIYLSVLKIDNNNSQANLLHGSILSQKSSFKEAIVFLKKAEKSNSDNYEVNNNLGIAYKNLKDFDNAEKHFIKAISIDSKNYKAHFNCANVYIDQKKYDLAKSFLENTIVCNNSFAEAYQRYGDVLQLQFFESKNINFLIESKKYFTESIKIDPSYSDSFIALALTHLWLGEVEESANLFDKALTINSSSNSVMSKSIIEKLSDIKSTKTLIKHEYEQLTFVDNDIDSIRNPKFTKEYYQELKNLYLKIKNNSFDIEDVTSSMKTEISKILYNKPPKTSSSNLINEKNDIESLESEYLGKNPEILVVDNFLTPEALLELQEFYRNANIFKYPYGNGYVGAFLAKGLSNKFILKLTEDLRKTYKNIFTNLQLTQAWAFKYDSKSKGINVHADDASINVNFWITPDHANLNKKTGGLKIWNKLPPKEWDFEEFNYNSPKIIKMLEAEKIKHKIIEYKENRAVIFNSKLFHATDNYNFKDSYEDRRVNMTFLYD